jgi:hypothetical protein
MGLDYEDLTKKDTPAWYNNITYQKGVICRQIKM